MRGKIRPRYRVGLTAFMALVAMALFTSSASAIVAGAGFTTNDPNSDGSGTCLNGNSDPNPSVNCNLYGSKSFVWINGGPSAGQNHLTDGTYFFAVLEPSGQNNPNDGGSNNLSDTDPAGGIADPNLCAGGGTNTLTGCGDAYTNREFTVSGGKIATSLGSHGTDNFYSGTHGLMINLMPYDTTSNPGGVYILSICQVSTDTAETTPETLNVPVTPSSCKYDAFKAPNPACTSNCNPTPFGVVSGEKYYDANLNGQLDPGESGIPGWNIDWTDAASGTAVTDANGLFSLQMTADAYTFTEEQATNQSCTNDVPKVCVNAWVQTGNTVNQALDSGGNGPTALNNFVYSDSVVDGGVTSGLNFGNVCLGKGGTGLTIGFWSNKNGQALETQADFAALTALNLVNADGSPRDFTGTLANNKKALNSWLLNAKATNMAYMLSAQLAGMELNVLHGFVSGSSIVYTSALGFVTINDVMSAANTSLGAHPITKSGSAYRTYQENRKNALDLANNNLNFFETSLANCAAVPPTFS